MGEFRLHLSPPFKGDGWSERGEDPPSVDGGSMVRSASREGAGHQDTHVRGCTRRGETDRVGQTDCLWMRRTVREGRTPIERIRRGSPDCGKEGGGVSGGDHQVET